MVGAWQACRAQTALGRILAGEPQGLCAVVCFAVIASRCAVDCGCWLCQGSSHAIHAAQKSAFDKVLCPAPVSCAAPVLMMAMGLSFCSGYCFAVVAVATGSFIQSVTVLGSCCHKRADSSERLQTEGS